MFDRIRDAAALSASSDISWGGDCGGPGVGVGSDFGFSAGGGSEVRTGGAAVEVVSGVVVVAGAGVGLLVAVANPPQRASSPSSEPLMLR